jgi:DNA modification methylase
MAMKNKIYYGDNLEVLRNYLADESVDLCYIDPPFNSKRNYNQIYNNVGKEDKAQAQAFIDTWTWDEYAQNGLFEIQSNYNRVFTAQSIDLITGLEKVLKKGSLFAYLVSMTLRIAEIHRILKPTGSFYLHCDPTASHYLKLVLDAVFCPQSGNFQNEIIWQRTSSHNDSKKWGAVHDVIFFYTKASKFTWNKVYLPHSEKYVNDFYRHRDERGVYRLDHIIRSQSMGKRPNLSYEYKGYTPEWGWRVLQEKLVQLDAENRLAWSSTGRPYLKRYLHEQQGTPIKSVITDINPLSASSAEKLGYPTQKPEALLERIIQASSNEGDVILDAYCGCGTSIAVAEKLQRQWIGIDITYQSISLILKRLEDQFGYDFTQDVIDENHPDTPKAATLELNGVPKDFASAVELANRKDDRTRKEFEKWMVLSYSRNQAIINEKKGSDGGIDGIAYVPDRNAKGEIENKKALFSVKSNAKLSPAVIRELNGTIEREHAACGFLLTLYPMPNLVKESKQYGNYQNSLINKSYPKIQVICVDELLNGARLELPNVVKVLKTAEQHVDQMGLDYE